MTTMLVIEDNEDYRLSGDGDIIDDVAAVSKDNHSAIKRCSLYFLLFLLVLCKHAWAMDSNDGTLLMPQGNPFSTALAFNAKAAAKEANFNSNAPSDNENQQTIFNEKELAWLQQHPEIRIGTMNAWPPMDFVDKQGNPQGIGAQFIGALNLRLNGALIVKPGSWEEIYNGVKTGKFDALTGITPRPDREVFFNFTNPYINIPHAIFSRSDLPAYTGLENLKGKKVAVERGFFIGKVLRDKFPKIEVKEYDSTSDALDAVSKESVDAYIGNRAVAMYIIKNELIANLHQGGKIKQTSSTNAIGVRKDWPILKNILQKALNDISEEERREILSEWIAPDNRVNAVPDFALTAEEVLWLTEHKLIRIGIMDAWPPFNFVDKDGTPKGIGVDYIKALNQRLDDVLEIVPGDWKTIYSDVKEKRLDALMDITPKPEREAHFNFTDPYLDIPHVIVANKDTPFISSEDSLKGKTLALEKDFGNVKYFRDNYPQVKIKEYRDTPHALGAVSRGEADAYAGNRSVALYIIEKEVISNLQVHGRLKKNGSILAIGTRKDWPMLRDILQKALNDISLTEQREIVSQWVAPERVRPAASVITLTDEEKGWLANNPVIRTASDRNWAPIEYVDEEGYHQGISADYIKHLEKMLGVRFEVAKELNWQESVTAFKRGELDIFTSMKRTPERENYTDFTDVYTRFPIAIFTGPKIPYVGSVEELKGLRVGVVEGYATHELLARDHPELEFVPVASTVEALKKLSHGEIDSYIGALLVTSYYIGQLGYTNIKVAGETGYAYEQSIAVRKDWPIFVSILNKALAAIPESERKKINNRWIGVRYEHGFDYSLLWKFMAAALIVFAFGIYWNRRLAQLNTQLEAARNKEAEARRVAELAMVSVEQANRQLKELDKLKSMFIASMSHELRTPLNSIIGFSGMLLQGLSGDINDEQRDDLQRVSRAGNHLLSLITDIIDISKIEAGRIESHPEHFPLKELIEEAVEEVRLQADKKGISIEIQADTWSEMNTDRKRLLQCLLNYLSNAVKFSEQGKVIVSISVNENIADISVADTGIGIAEDDIPKLFEAFERLESHLRVKAGGTGLGLYLTKKISGELLHGSVTVESQLGKGSTFGLKIPIDIAAIKIVHDDEAKHSNVEKQLTAELVEDHK